MTPPYPAGSIQRPKTAFSMMLLLRLVYLGTNVVSVVVMSRLLLPEDFGVAAMSLTIIGLATVLRDLGLTSLTIQKSSLSASDFGALFWVNAGASLGLATILAATSGLAGILYDQPALQGVVLVSTIGFLISGLSAQHRAILQRSMMFRGILVADSAGMIGGISAAVAAAITVGGPLSLAIAGPVGASISSAIIFKIAPRMALPFPHLPHLREIMPSSANLTAFGLTGFISNNIGQVLVGLLLGPVLLGHFNRASQLFQMPTVNLIGPLSQVMFPVLSRHNDNPAAYRACYRAYLLRQSALLLPIAAVLPFISESLMLVLLGPGWSTAAMILAWFAPAIASQGLAGTSGIALMSQGRSSSLRNWGFVDVLIRGSGTGIGLYIGGVEGTAAGFSLAGLLVGTPAIMYLVGRTGPISFKDQAQQFVPSLAMAAAAMTGCLSLQAWLKLEPGFMNLLGTAIAGLLPAAAVAVTVPSTRQDIRLVLTSAKHAVANIASYVPDLCQHLGIAGRRA